MNGTLSSKNASQRPRRTKTTKIELVKVACRVALTGGIATGKSCVLKRFATLGAQTLEADMLARSAVAPDGPAWHAIRDRFGSEMFDDRGLLDRSKLGALVFSDETARVALNAIVHPHVRTEINHWFSNLDSTRSSSLGIVAIPLFYENPRAEIFDHVIVTACLDDTQLTRIMARGLSKDAAKRRIATQLPTMEKVRRADSTIWTDGPHAKTTSQVRHIFKELSATWNSDKSRKVENTRALSRDP